jgi:serine phosphatase RsbU (regulator of sigma subunit)
LSTERALNALIEISTATAEFIDPIEQGRVTLDTVVRLLSAERACIFLGADSSALKFFLGRTAKAEDIVEMKGFSTTVVRKVFEERKAVIITGTEQGEAIGSKSIVAHNLKSIMVVPLMLQENIKGVIYLDSSINKGLFSNDDLDLFVAISAQIAASLQISELAASESERQLMKKDLEISASVQKMFLPEKVHLDISDVKVEAFYRPAAQCGGDWWWYRSQAGHVAVVVGDVTGHGAGPAMITASIATCFRMMQSARDVRELLLAAHSQLLEIAQTEYAMAMFAVDVDVQSRKVKYWSAGAPQALVIHKDEKKSSHLHVKGSWLGMHNFVLGEAEYDFREGDRIFIFSDGIVEMEMTDGRQFGERRLDGLLQKYKSLSLEDFKLKLVEELDQIRGGSAQEDDFTFVVIELH